MQKQTLDRSLIVFNGGPGPRPQNHKPNVTFRNAGNGVAEVFLYEEIGYWGITAKEFSNELKALGDVSVIKNHINSPGGDVFEAAAIYQLLAQHPATVETHIDGMAMSAATVVALAGDSVAMAENGLFMIHDPMTFAMGNKAELTKVIEILDKVTETIVGVYTAKTGDAPEKMRELMAAETYFTAAEAKAAKFVDTINPNKQVAALWTPDKIRDAFQAALTGNTFDEFKREFLNLEPLTKEDGEADWEFENRMMLRQIESQQLQAAA